MHLTNIDSNKSVSEIVRTDYRTADVFKKHGINYCCSGQLSLADACTLKNLNCIAIQTELENATQDITVPANVHFKNWRLNFLIDYITHVHHDYLQQTLPALETALVSFLEGHKKKFPELTGILTVYQELSSLLIKHIWQEEETIFPYIKQMESTYRRKEVYGSLFIRTMRKPLPTVLEKEHKQINALLIQLRQHTDAYHFKSNACTNHQVIYHKLHELDNHIVQQQHLEYSILYPKAIEIERELLHL